MRIRLLFTTLVLACSLTACQNVSTDEPNIQDSAESSETVENTTTGTGLVTDIGLEFIEDTKEDVNIEVIKEETQEVVKEEDTVSKEIFEVIHETSDEEGLKYYTSLSEDERNRYVYIPADWEIIGKTPEGYSVIMYNDFGEAVIGFDQYGDCVIGFDENGYPIQEHYEALGYTDDGFEIFEYAEDGTPIIGYTAEGDKIIRFTEDGQAIVKGELPSDIIIANNSSKPSTNTSLPYIINGIDIRDGDFNGDGVNDNNGNTWYEGQTWTASNGVTIKIADKYYVEPGGLNEYDCFFRDGTENLDPTGDYMYAVNEYLGRLSISTISPKDLPSINLVSTRQTSLDKNNSSYLAYKAAFDPLWQKQNKTEGSSFSGLQIIDNNQDGIMDGIGLIDSLGSLGYMWTIDYNSIDDYWVFSAIGSYTQLIWDSIHNALRMITPDADIVFDAIYQAFYHDYPGLVVPQYSVGDWVTVGNTQLKTDYSSGKIKILIK